MTERENTYSVNITSGIIIRSVLFGALFFLAFYLRDLILILLTSIVVASAIEPFVLWLKERKIPRVPAVVIIYVFLFLLTFVLVSTILPLVFDDFFKLFSTIPSYIKGFSMSDYISDTPARIIDSIKNALADSFSAAKIMPDFSGFLSGTSESVMGAAKTIFSGLYGFVFIVVFSFYLAVQERGIEGFLKLVTPLKYEAYTLDLWKRSRNKIGLWFQGQILLGVLIGVFVFLGLSILGMKNALTLAVFAALFEIIPVFGPILAAVPAVLLAFIQRPALGVIVLAFFIVIQQFENHLIYPLVVRKIIGIPPLLAIIFLIIGGRLAGFLGFVVAIPVTVVLLEIAEDFEKKKRFIHATSDK